MKNYFIAIVLITTLALALGIPVLADEAHIVVNLDGKAIQFSDQQPVINSDGRTLVPARAVFEAMGCNVNWEGTNQLVTISNSNIRILLKIGESQAVVNDLKTGSAENEDFDTKASILNGRTMLPLRFISETLGSKVSWNDSTKTVDINTHATAEELKQPDNIADLAMWNPDIPKDLYEYPYNKDAKTVIIASTNKPLLDFMTNKEFSIKDTNPDYAFDKLINIAKSFIELDDTVDYRNMSDYETNLLFYCPTGGNTKQLVDKWVNDVKTYNLVEECKFITDPSMIYKSNDSYIRVRGRRLTIYHSPSNADYVAKQGMQLEHWYEQDIEVALTIPMDAPLWIHSRICPIQEIMLNNKHLKE